LAKMMTPKTRRKKDKKAVTRDSESFRDGMETPGDRHNSRCCETCGGERCVQPNIEKNRKDVA